MRTPVRARHASASGHGHGAAPESAIADASRSPRASSRARRACAGTWSPRAGNTVTRCSIAPRATTASGEKRSTITTAAPASSGASSAPLMPNECESGSTAQHAIVGHERHHRAHPRGVARGDGGVGEHGALGAAGAARRVEHERRRLGVLDGRRRRASRVGASASTDSTTARAPKSLRIAARSSAVSCGLSGVTVTPSLSAP